MFTFKDKFKEKETDFYRELEKQRNQKFESFDFMWILVFGLLGYLCLFLLNLIRLKYGY